jgi:hypothetical protein
MKEKYEAGACRKCDLSNRILGEADNILKDRREEYGDSKEGFVLISRYWDVYIKNELITFLDGYVEEEHNVYENCPQLRELREAIIQDEYVIINAHDVAIMQVLLKAARTANKPKKRDNYLDICGYGALAAEL